MKATYYGPAHRDIDIALEALGIEDARQREALRRYYLRERSAGLALTGKRVLWGFLIAMALIGVGVGFGWGWLFPIGR